ncbi:hybrid sensor histidine kinase/response regulator transcription factor [Parapedobacter tibetensis]|uniref:hybrid sensor histidine kinase/response regulator transcription factor n=1 Tax=Parapedobacter tibetensis TaxID=2972951 RepID=UPI00214DBA8C|nr:two-component regulator propeller domain-containing protein [Parapedobacter tibetensis]
MKRIWTFLISVFSVIGLAFSQAGLPIHFQHIGTKDGLSQSMVASILKDRMGFMWFATQDGLNRYDGYQFKVYKHNPADSTSISYNHISSLLEDRSGTLWVATRGEGIARYNRKDDSFVTYGGGAVNTLYEDSMGVLWIGTFAGVYVLDREENRVVAASHNDERFKEIAHLSVSAICEDSEGTLWIGTSQGGFMLKKGAGQLSAIPLTAANGMLGGAVEVTTLLEDSEGSIWVGTRNGLFMMDKEGIPRTASPNLPVSLGNTAIHTLCQSGSDSLWVGTEQGLVLLNRRSGKSTLFQRNANDVQSLSHNSIYSLYYDRQGVLWVGTFAGGVNVFAKNQLFFRKYQIRNPVDINTNTNVVSSFAVDKDEKIWMGSDGGGLHLWDMVSNRYTPYNKQSGAASFPSDVILSLLMSSSQESLWVGTYDEGLVRLNTSRHTLDVYHKENGKLRNNAVYALLEDKKGNLWVGTNGGGVTVLDPNGRVAKHFGYGVDTQRLNNETIRALMEDADGNIWIGTYYGVNIYHPDTERFTYLNKGNSNLGSNVVYAIHQDSKGRIWVGTMGGGLYLYNSKQRNFTVFTETDGLVNNIVNHILEDRNGNLWVSTVRGISFLDGNTLEIRNYGVEDGLQGNEFVQGAGVVGPFWDLLFGGVDGFNMFDPDNIHVRSNPPPVVITDFRLPNSDVGNGVLHKRVGNISVAHEITLDPDQTVFTIEFAALSYTSAQRNQYAYKLEGFDKDWIFNGNRTEATYTNLDAGEYIFRVKVSDNRETWDEEGVSLKIIIKPPIWKSGYAYVVYAILLTSGLYFLFREIRIRERLKGDIFYQKLASKEIAELNELKINFFTNISHELRTPLSLILDPLRQIVSNDLSQTQAKSLGALAYRNATRLLNLVNQLLDFRKSEGNLKVHISSFNIIEFVGELAERFQNRVDERKISLSFRFQTSFPVVFTDLDKLDKILSNLLSNAIKFTPEHGEIVVLTQTGNDHQRGAFLKIQIEDSGPGIPRMYKDRIFEAFFQVDKLGQFDMDSTGIGLAVVKELTLLLKGEVFEDGREGQGARFVVSLPAKVEIEADIDDYPDDQKPELSAMENSEPIEPSDFEDGSADCPILLLVEDNEDLRAYLRENLTGKYVVKEASNGLDGLEQAMSLVPDLIISDIMMAKMDGMELCSRLKADEKTSHIPVILLTAKQRDEHKIAGYGSGADAYITKPFNSDVLAAQVKSLLASRKTLREWYANEAKAYHFEANLSNLAVMDQEFMRRAEEAVLHHLSDSRFDIDSLAETLKMNRRQLSRKLKAVAGYTPQEYVIGIRMRQAATLLIAGDLTVAEVAYSVGFTEPANFTRSFTRVYGKSPKKFVADTLAVGSK